MNRASEPHTEVGADRRHCRAPIHVSGQFARYEWPAGALQRGRDQRQWTSMYARLIGFVAVAGPGAVGVC
ncbi:hypothetical protein [Mycobacterium sp. E796]|uniref:hypothetical protein n=1 Tax=Mycobacterium sp. E796 TaxID=1834151 RepID=UPI0012E9EC8D|nr:hypothetical protein [Mycobacterium sp. E796]